MYRRALPLIALIAPYAAEASAPPLVPATGYLTDSVGAPINDQVTLHLKLYRTSNTTTNLWEEIQTVDVDNGQFTVYLGQTTPLPLTTFQRQLDAVPRHGRRQRRRDGAAVSGRDRALRRLRAVLRRRRQRRRGAPRRIRLTTDALRGPTSPACRSPSPTAIRTRCTRTERACRSPRPTSSASIRP